MMMQIHLSLGNMHLQFIIIFLVIVYIICTTLMVRAVLQMQSVVSYWQQTQGFGNFLINIMTLYLTHAMFFSSGLC